MSLLLAGIATTLFGSWGAFATWARGEKLYVPMRTIRITGAKPGEKVRAVFVIQNVTSRPVKLLGSHTGCSCIVAENLPMSIAPAQMQSVAVTISLPNNLEGDSLNEVELFVDHPDERLRLQVVLAGTDLSRR